MIQETILSFIQENPMVSLVFYILSLILMLIIALVVEEYYLHQLPGLLAFKMWLRVHDPRIDWDKIPDDPEVNDPESLSSERKPHEWAPIPYDFLKQPSIRDVQRALRERDTPAMTREGGKDHA